MNKYKDCRNGDRGEHFQSRPNERCAKLGNVAPRQNNYWHMLIPKCKPESEGIFQVRCCECVVWFNCCFFVHYFLQRFIYWRKKSVLCKVLVELKIELWKSSRNFFLIADRMSMCPQSPPRNAIYYARRVLKERKFTFLIHDYAD